MKSEIFFIDNFYKLNDNEKPRQFGHEGFYFSETGIPKEDLKLDNLSFKEFWDYNRLHSIDGVHLENSLFRKKPIIGILEYYGENIYYKENSFKTISVYTKQRKGVVSLEWIFKHLSTNSSIKYLNDRGMNMCPLGKGE